MWMAAVAIMTAAVGADGQILGTLENGAPPAEMMTLYLRGKMEDAFAQRAEVLEQDLATPESILDRGQRMREFFVQQLGGWPEKTPLNARVIDKGERDGYRYEKILFESRPNFFVTAVMYLPVSEGPYPGVLVPCGHDANGKAAEAYQRAAIFLAHNGIAAMIYDPIGQGERSQLLNADGKQKYGSTIEHTMVTVGSIPLGLNVAGYRVWDGIRGIDYLCSRDDIDPERIGCTGNSGGGTLTSYIMALDERVLCAAPSCYITSLKNLITIDGPHDGEQNIAGALAFGMDHADFLLMRAPRPTLICCATRDFFPIVGVWDSYRVAKRAYTKLGFEERVNLAEADEEHGYTPLLRQAMVRWMLRWLKGVDEPVVEGEFDVLTDAEVQVTPQGQVLLLEGARSVFDINADVDTALAEARKNAPKENLNDQVRDITGIRPLAELPEPRIVVKSESTGDGFTLRHVVLTPEIGIELPVTVYLPEAPNGEAICAVANGKAELDALDQLAQSGSVVVAPDLRGLGETTSNWTHGEAWDNAFGPGYKATSLAYLLDRPILTMRAEDVLVCARFAATYENAGEPRKVKLVAHDAAGPPALHAAALEPDLFSVVRLERALQSWSSVVRTPETVRQYENTVHGALRVYDLPDLVESLGDKVEVIDPTDAAGNPINAE
jgi:dienelactone hydrolase